VTRSTKPATAMSASRICFRQRAIATPPLPAGAAAPAPDRTLPEGAAPRPDHDPHNGKGWCDGSVE
jgi:hypothetical protein